MPILSGILVGSQLSLLDHALYLSCRVTCTVGASIFPVYGIAPYLEFRSNLEYLSAGGDRLRNRLCVRDRLFGGRPDCRW